MPPNTSPAQPEPDPPAPRLGDLSARLRDIPGGYDLDTPPIHIAPVPGESAISWLRRAALRYQISPRSVLREGGARKQIASTAAATRRVLAPWNSHTARRLGLTAGERAALRAPTPLGAALTAHARLYQRTPAWAQAWTQVPASRYCPACLADPEPWWQKDWSNPLQTVCAHHDLLLLTRCPACQSLPHERPSWLAEPLELWRCTARTDPPPSARRQVRPWCGHDLRTAPTRQAEPDQARAQHLLASLAHDPDKAVEMCGITLTGRIAFDAMIELTAAALHRRGSHVEQPPEEVATALAETLDVLERATPQRAGVHLQGLLRPTSRQAPITHSPTTASVPKNPLLGALQLGHHAGVMSPASQLTFRTGARHGQYPPPPGQPKRNLRHLLLPEHQPHLPLPSTAWIPQIIWPATIPGLDDDPVARAEMSLLLARLGTARPWGALVVELGLPTQFHHTLIARTRTRRANGTWPPLLARLDHVLEQLRAKRPWVNYRHRRILADDLPLLTRALTTAHPDRHHPGLGVQRRFWELFTGGDALLAPDPLTVPGDAHDQWREHRRQIDAEHTTRFDTAFQILDRSSPLRLGKPLTWRPP